MEFKNYLTRFKKNPPEWLPITLAFCVWIFLFRAFVFGQIPVNVDSNSNFAFLKFFYNNLLNGVLPLWDPFPNLGRPYIFTNSSGVLNPITFIVFYSAGLLKLGYYNAYLFYLVLYYFIGQIGFYLLSKEIFKDKLFAFYSFFFLLFAGSGVTIFNQVNMLLIFVPSVWFFYFLLKFAQAFHKKYFIAMTYCLMVMVSSYLPFYFVTVFVIFGILIGILFPLDFRRFFKGLMVFIKNYWLLFMGCGLAVCIVMLPLVMYALADRTGENVTPGRQCLGKDMEKCFAAAMSTTSAMSYEAACSGGLETRLDFKNLFSHLDKVSYASDSLFYLPIFCYLILVMAVFTHLNRKLILFSCLGVLIYLIGITAGSFLQFYLYQFVFYFKYFRNFFFFMAFLMPVIVLLTTLQLEGILKYRKPDQQQKGIYLLIHLTHFLFLLFLLKQKNILFASYMTVIASWIVFAVYFKANIFYKDRQLILTILALTILQPFYFYKLYTGNAKTFQCPIPDKHVKPAFVFQRPEKDYQSECRLFKYFALYIDYWHTLTMQDSSGKLWFSANTSRWAFTLLMRMSNRVFMDYARNKIVVYDHVAYLDESDLETAIATLKDSFQNKRNIAVIADDDQEVLTKYKIGAEMPQDSPLVISQGSDQLKILDFTVNTLKLRTNFDSPKFLVYNDSFNSNWKVFVNDRQQKVYRANFAFKGVQLPPGENQVYFSYEPVGGAAMYYFLLAFYGVFFVFMIYVLVKKERKNSDDV